jgi:uncharacterized damage-inducible protein DinB
MAETLDRSLDTLLRELVDGPSAKAAWVLNAGDQGLLRSLEALSAAAASTSPASGGASIAAHVDHLRYGLSLMNRWAGGEANPWATADWTASWQRTSVDDAGWQTLRQALAAELRAWLETVRQGRTYSQMELNDAIASIAHLAYHFGAIRQIDRSIRGPLAG